MEGRRCFGDAGGERGATIGGGRVEMEDEVEVERRRRDVPSSTELRRERDRPRPGATGKDGDERV